MSYLKGIIAECLAILILILKGYWILRWRYKRYGGEIDIIACKGGVINFVEVKKRNSIHDGMEAISMKQRRRISATAKIFVGEYTKPNRSIRGYRFDALILGKYFMPLHIQNAWGLN